MRRTHLFSAVLVVVLSITACGGKQEPGAGGGGGPPGGMQLPVETVTLQPQALAGGLQTVGSLRADESVVMRPEVGGRITRIHFTEGGRVRQGEALYQIDDAVYRASDDSARAALARAPATLTTARLNAQRSAEGFYARSGFAPRGDGFEEVGLPHIEMVRSV